MEDSEYVWSKLHRFLNMPGLERWEGCEYARVIQSSNKPDYSLIMPEFWMFQM